VDTLRGARHVRLCIAALVAALLVVPPLVSAFDGYGGPACLSLRINRAFAASSVAKGKAKPLSHDSAAQSAGVYEKQALPRIIARAAAPEESILESPADRSPETRPGPPHALLAWTLTPRRRRGGASPPICSS